MTEGPIKLLDGAGLRIRRLLQLARVEPASVEMVLKLKSERDEFQLRTTIKADCESLPPFSVVAPTDEMRVCGMPLRIETPPLPHETSFELFVFAHAEHARSAGFLNGRHRGLPHLIAWWPESPPDRLRGYSFSRVTVTDGARRHAHRNDALTGLLVEGLHHARRHLRIPPMLWIDL